jgi:uncharacterized membrane protein SpoIIM required for sporulation
MSYFAILIIGAAAVLCAAGVIGYFAKQEKDDDSI